MATLEKFKLSALSYDYDKEPKGFFIWLESMGGFVRSTDGGADLEDMLDSKLHRKPNIGKMIPSFLQDPDFDPVPDGRPGGVPADGAQASWLLSVTVVKGRLSSQDRVNIVAVTI